MDERARAEGKLTTDDIHARAIEDVLYFSSLLTFAVFIGLSQTYDGNRSQEKHDKCTAGPEIHRKLIISEVLAFACFLSSSLCAKALKLLITSHEKKRRHYILIAGSFELKGLMLYCTALFSLTGIFALVVSVIHLVQMQVGMYSCANKATRTIIWVFCAIVLIVLEQIGSSSGNRIDVG